MKRMLTVMMMAVGVLTSWGQGIELTADGSYEKKEMVTVDSTEAAVLYARAMEALSDWTGLDGNSRMGIDHHDREAGTVVYKGDYFLEYKTGVTVTANFTLVNIRRTESVAKVAQSKKKSSQRFVGKLPEVADLLIMAMSERLRHGEDDDF